MTDDATQDLISVKMACSVMYRYKPEQMLWHYEHGLVLQGIYTVGKKYNLPELTVWVKNMYDTKIQADGSILTYKKDEFNLDQINPGKVLFDLYAETGEERYRAAIETLQNQLRKHPRTNSGGFWHKKIYPWQMWLDGLYMQGPFYARYAAQFGNTGDFEDVVHQFELVFSHTRDADTGLLYHAWDESCSQLWADSDTGCSPHFWGRAMGWFCMAVLDVLDWIPSSDDYQILRDRMIAIAQKLVEPVLSFQDTESGLWYQVLDMGMREKNYQETSASAMFVYFLYKFCRNSLPLPLGVEQDTVLAAADKGFKGLCARLSSDKDHNLHLSGICSVAGLGGNPYRDGSYDYYVKEPVVDDDFKGVGPFIYAALEAEAYQATHR